MKKAFITGITGQDGSYLSELLLKKGYEVHGMVRRTALEDPDAKFSRLNHIKGKLKLHSGTLESYERILELFDQIKPDECYHLAAQSFVGTSFEDRFTTFKTNIDGTQHVLSALLNRTPQCKFYFAGTSEMFGNSKITPQNENTPFHPRSPYGISKVAGFYLTQNYREAYGIFACSGILFNHESPRRGYEFVTRKISREVARIKGGEENVLVLGNLKVKRDWGYAGDYVKAMYKMMQQRKPDDFVIATGENHSIKDLCKIAFGIVDLKYKIVDLSNLSIKRADQRVRTLRKEKSRVFIVQHPRFYRPAEVYNLLGDASKARKKLNWKPKVEFAELVEMMIKNDLKESL